MMRRLGAIPLDTEDPSTSTFRKAEALLQAGETVVIFPEGGIHPHSLAPLKPGLSRLVVRLERKYQYEIPVVPIAISYSPADQRGAHARVEILATLRTATWRETGNGKNTPAADKTVAAAMTRQLSLSLSSPLHQSPVEQQQSDVRPWQNKAL
jgi:1-acyl-sn-glycerol-3-phosphate acyltransferase